MLRSVAQIMEKGIDPSGGQFGAIGVKMAGEAPEVFAAMIEVQRFGRLGEAIFDQVPYPDGAINDDEHFLFHLRERGAKVNLDLSTARILIQGNQPHFDTGSYHCQQAAEKGTERLAHCPRT